MSTQHIQLNVPIHFDQIVEIVKQLTPSEKQRLSHILHSDKNSEDIIITEKQKQEVKQRLKHLNDKPETALSWKDIEDKIKL
jgi:hypothetical protein